VDVEQIRRAADLGADTALRPERFGALAYDFDTRRLSFVRRRSQAHRALNDEFERGLDAPICLTWELTYACNLACVHCLSSSGRRDPRELSTAECKAVIDDVEDADGDELVDDELLVEEISIDGMWGVY